ncbi:MAG: hypothetical protein WEG40_12785 [Candidatus Rokuibacteriota bacterium]
MTTENNSGTLSPDADETVETVELHDKQAPTPDPRDAPAPSRLAQIDRELSELDWKNAQTREAFAAVRAKHNALVDERAGLDAPEEPGDGEPEAYPEPTKYEDLTGDPVPLALPDALTPSQQEVAKGYAEDIGFIAKDAGIPQAEAQVLFDVIADVNLTELTDGHANLANPQECMSLMNTRWGIEATKNIVAAAQDAVRRLPPRVRDYLDTPNAFNERLSNSPAVIFALAAWATGESRRSPEQARAALKELRKDPKYLAGDKLTRDRANMMNRIASRAQAAHREVANKVNKPAALTGRELTERKIAEIRRDPNYYKNDNPMLHKQLVGQMSELMRQLHPESK